MKYIAFSVASSVFLQADPCFNLKDGEETVVSRIRLRRTSFLLAKQPSAAGNLFARNEVMAAIEDLLSSDSYPAWVVDAGADETSQVGNALGYNVLALDQNIHEIRQMDQTRCINNWKHFQTLPALALDDDGKNENGAVVSLDTVFDPSSALITGLDVDVSIRLLKTPDCESCFSRAIEGVRNLLDEKRIQCVAGNFIFDKESLATWEGLQKRGFTLAHSGPWDLPPDKAKVQGPQRPRLWFRTSVKQLLMIATTLGRIHKYDMRNGERMVDGGIALSKDGKYVRFGEPIIACRDSFGGLEVQKPRKAIYGDGLWWLEETKTTNSTASFLYASPEGSCDCACCEVHRRNPAEIENPNAFLRCGRKFTVNCPEQCSSPHNPILSASASAPLLYDQYCHLSCRPFSEESSGPCVGLTAKEIDQAQTKGGNGEDLNLTPAGPHRLAISEGPDEPAVDDVKQNDSPCNKSDPCIYRRLLRHQAKAKKAMKEAQQTAAEARETAASIA
eukprot:GEMP01028938.1.p1 GENE.GEMP01028938.1~~GEMP01028938.1.p1  ORF type:complete len:503 (+),score=98.44 GEMP01028938.1:241-1749(+)